MSLLLVPNVLPYHVGPEDRFSLEFVHPDRREFEAALADRATREGASFKSREIAIEAENGPDTLYAIYSRSASEALLDDQTESDLGRILDEQYTSGQLQVLEMVLDVFLGITDTVENEGYRFTIYKEMDLTKIPDILVSPDWGNESVTDVGGQLLSRFILAHPMPNANHRTAIGLLERYLRSHGDEFAVPDTGELGTWYEWAQPYIHDSKRLLTVRRNAHVFRYAQEYGVEVIRRKNGVDIDLDSFDLDVDNPYEYFSIQHEQRSIDFVETILEQTEADATRFEATDDPGFDAFVETLRTD